MSGRPALQTERDTTSGRVRGRKEKTSCRSFPGCETGHRSGLRGLGQEDRKPSREKPRGRPRPIAGVGIPANTTIQALDTVKKTITLSQAATATATGVALATPSTFSFVAPPSGSVLKIIYDSAEQVGFRARAILAMSMPAFGSRME